MPFEKEVKIVVCQTDGDFAKALDFVLPYEKFCCALTEKIICKSDSIFCVNDGERAAGLFYFKRKCTVLCCFPHKNKAVAKALINFFSDKDIYALACKSDYAAFLEKILGFEEKDKKSFYLMQCKTPAAASAGKPCAQDVVLCSIGDAEALMPLHINFTKEEVLPSGKDLYVPSLLHDLENLLKRETVLALKKDGIFIGKVQTNAASENFIQIGGVYTLSEYRNKGVATLLTNSLVLEIFSRKKVPLLFVNKKNYAALSLYKKCGFTKCGSFCVIYF